MLFVHHIFNKDIIAILRQGGIVVKEGEQQWAAGSWQLADQKAEREHLLDPELDLQAQTLCSCLLCVIS